MPKTLILFHSRWGATAALADAIADGARAVRFSEVAVRRLDHPAPEDLGDATPEQLAARAALLARYSPLDHVEELAQYDGIILGAPSGSGDVSPELQRVLDQADALRASGTFTNTVGSAFAAVSARPSDHDAIRWSLLRSMANLGMILVPAPSGGADHESAERQGRRVAELVSWVAHARSHAHAHTH